MGEVSFNIFVDRRYSVSATYDVVLKTEMPDVGIPKRGKVRDIYDFGDYLLLVATDRVSAFDVVLPNGIPGKGRVLTQISIFWFRLMQDIVKNHLVATDINDFPGSLRKYKDTLEGRSILVKKAKPLPIESIVRGYLSGSGWKEYREKGTVCGISLPHGLVESSRLEESIFTPSTKAVEGHDINISIDEVKKLLGNEKADWVKTLSLQIYSKARAFAENKGIIIADTKFEFGMHDGEIILIDEILTPDSSRFWSMKDYQPGRGQKSFDKQIVRDYLLTLDWDKTPPGPMLPDDIVIRTAERYREIVELLVD
ncbi:MAG TPA: phosphoribosylaminoimidazolesuccinocarboxamide synthase [Nitrospiraceae bacterium]|jgi:phosphoribosylaminoimidazole-succinocarboxamide synthase|nr:phosphoribosylaminoimidazolesuccinocarboxamide synthase [Nitrospiraceae bacterium]